MKVMLRREGNGDLSVYVPKKDLEEIVVNQTDNEAGTVLTLANGWELQFPQITEDIQLPQTIQATKL